MPTSIAWILFGTTLVLFVLLIVEIVQRRKSHGRLHQMIKYLHRQIEKNEQEIARHRYYIAMLRRMVNVLGVDEDATRDLAQRNDEKMLEAAVDELTKVSSDKKTEETVEKSEDILEKDDNNDIPQKQAVEAKVADNDLLKLIKVAIKNNEIDIIRQPIVTLPQRKPRHYEVFSRIKLGKEGYISAGRFMSLAANANLVPMIDNLILLRTLQLLRNDKTNDVSSAYFCNISAQTLNNRSFMNDLIDFLDMNPQLAPRLVFEMKQADLANLKADTKRLIDGLDKLGCRFSMDQVKLLGIDTIALQEKRISFIKFDASRLLEEIHEKGNLGRIRKLKAQIEAANVEVIVEKIETEKQMLDLISLYVDYGQGYLFGAPK